MTVAGDEVDPQGRREPSLELGVARVDYELLGAPQPLLVSYPSWKKGQFII